MQTKDEKPIACILFKALCGNVLAPEVTVWLWSDYVVSRHLQIVQSLVEMFDPQSQSASVNRVLDVSASLLEVPLRPSMQATAHEHFNRIVNFR